MKLFFKYLDISNQVIQKKGFFDLQVVRQFGKKVLHIRAMKYFFAAINRKKINSEYSITFVRVLKACLCILVFFQIGLTAQVDYENNPEFEKSIKEYLSMKESNPENPVIQEESLNDMGYKMIEYGNLEKAIGVFIINTRLYPASSNTYDSLGEEYMLAGNYDRAIKNYQKAAELDPSSFYATQMVDQLTAFKGFEKLSEPEKNYEAFWYLFDANYCFFDLKNIDWKARYEKHRSKVTANTTDDELYEIMVETLEGFNDAHVDIRVPNGPHFDAGKPSYIRGVLKEVKEELKLESDSKWVMLDHFMKMSDETLLKAGFEPMQYKGLIMEDKPWFYHTTSEDYGYLRFISCYSRVITEEGDLEVLLDEIFETFKGKKGIIIDVRLNGGGYDGVSFMVAGKLTKEKILGHTKQTRIKGDTYSEPEEHFIEPSGKHQFENPVIVLTNDRTVSAADVFALATKQLPNVKIVGDNSNGSFSDVLEKRMPNGWILNLSNQRYFSPDGENYEGKGVPVDVKMQNTLEDIVEKNDPIILKSLKMLGK